MEEMNVVIPEFQSEAEVYEWVMSQMVETEGEELSEDALEMVAGGMSTAQAWKIVSTVYWEYNVLKRKKSANYSSKQIMEALKICDKNAKKIGKGCAAIIKYLLPLI